MNFISLDKCNNILNNTNLTSNNNKVVVVIMELVDFILLPKEEMEVKVDKVAMEDMAKFIIWIFNYLLIINSRDNKINFNNPLEVNNNLITPLNNNNGTNNLHNRIHNNSHGTKNLINLFSQILLNNNNILNLLILWMTIIPNNSNNKATHILKWV